MAYNEPPAQSFTTTQYDVLVGGAANTIASVGPGTSGQIFQSAGNASNPAYTTSTYPSTNNTGDILYGSSSNVLSTLAAPTIPGSRLIWDGTNAYWYNPIKDVYLEDDFITNAIPSGYSWGSTVSGTGAAISRQNSTVSDSGHPGVLVYATGSTNAGNLCIQLQQNNGQGPQTFGGGQIDIYWVFNIPTLSNSTDTYTIRFGFGDQPSADMVAGAYLSYTDGATGATWVANTAQNSTRTQTSSNLVVTTGWHTAHIQINAAASSAAFFMDGSALNISPLSTNIPSGTANNQKFGPIFQMLKSAGTTSIAMIIDKVYMFQKVTNAR